MQYIYTNTEMSVWSCKLVVSDLSVFVFLDNGYIEGKELDAFFQHMLEKLGMKVKT